MKWYVILTYIVMTLSTQFLCADPASVTGTVASANNAFALDLYARLSQQPGNVLVSPFSVHTALAMTYAGARGETARQMAKALHFPARDSDLHAGFAALLKEMNQANAAGCELVIANSLWLQKNLSVKESFLKTTREQYAAHPNLVDFTAGEAVPRRRINEWVSAQTRGHIPEIVPPGMLNEDTRLVLVNAIYFKGIWAVEFDRSRTADSPFYLESGRAVLVPMMRQMADFGYVETKELQVLELPYTFNQLSMVILLPKKGHKLVDIEKNLTPDRIEQLRRKSRVQKVDVSLPRFKIQSDFRLNETLQAMGMVDAFLDGVADFSGMTDEERLFINAVLHKTYLEVDEAGTKAAAVTAVVMDRSAEPPAFVTFNANHPFLFLIRHNPTGAILLLGRVANPAL